MILGKNLKNHEIRKIWHILAQSDGNTITFTFTLYLLHLQEKVKREEVQKPFRNLKSSKELESNENLNNNIGVSSKGKVMQYEVVEVWPPEKNGKRSSLLRSFYQLIFSHFPWSWRFYVMLVSFWPR